MNRIFYFLLAAVGILLIQASLPNCSLSQDDQENQENQEDQKPQTEAVQQAYEQPVEETQQPVEAIQNEEQTSREEQSAAKVESAAGESVQQPEDAEPPSSNPPASAEQSAEQSIEQSLASAQPPDASAPAAQTAITLRIESPQEGAVIDSADIEVHLALTLTPPAAADASPAPSTAAAPAPPVPPASPLPATPPAPAPALDTPAPAQSAESAESTESASTEADNPDSEATPAATQNTQDTQASAPSSTSSDTLSDAPSNASSDASAHATADALALTPQKPLQARLFIDNQPPLLVDDISKPIMLSRLAEGGHLLRALAIDQEGRMIESAFAVTRFFVKKKDFKNRVDPQTPYLTLNTPLDGPVLVDTENKLYLEFIVRHGVMGPAGNVRVRYTLDGQSTLLDEPKPIALDQLSPGPHKLTVELTDRTGNSILGSFNNVERNFEILRVLQPLNPENPSDTPTDGVPEE